jgi:hypothetical protein
VVIWDNLNTHASAAMTELTAPVKTWLKRTQYRPALLEGFLTNTGLDRTPFGNLRD